MDCSRFAEKGLDALDYKTDTLAELGISDVLFLALKQGKAAFPMGSSDGYDFDANARAWMLGLCQIKTQTPVASPRLLNGSKTVQELGGVRRTIASYRDQLRADYMKLLASVVKASSFIKNPMMSTLMGKSENQYYKKTHDLLFGLNQATLSNCDSAVQRIDKFLSNKQNANMRTARAAANAAQTAARQQETNSMAAKYGLPPGSKSENVLRARLNSLRRGGKRRGGKQKTNRRLTRRRKV